jgi:small subunit ribosomal protein S17
MSIPAIRNNFRKKRIGIVLSDKMQKTIVVQIRRKALHPVYGKVVGHAAQFKVHDEKNDAKIGDRVLIQETRPLSKEKNWRLVQILEKGPGKLKKDLSASSDIKDVLEKAAAKATPPVTSSPTT